MVYNLASHYNQWNLFFRHRRNLPKTLSHPKEKTLTKNYKFLKTKHHWETFEQLSEKSPSFRSCPHLPCQEQAHSRLPGAGMRYGAVERSFIIVCKQGVVAVQCLVKGPADKDIKHQMMGKIEVVILRWLWSLSRRMKLGKRPMIIWTTGIWSSRIRARGGRGKKPVHQEISGQKTGTWWDFRHFFIFFHWKMEFIRKL